jgi:hypothetical protein
MSRRRFERRLESRRRSDRALAESDQLRRVLEATLEALELVRGEWTRVGRPGPDPARLEALLEERAVVARALLDRLERPGRPPGQGAGGGAG